MTKDEKYMSRCLKLVVLVLGLIVAAATKIYSLSKNREKVRVSTAIIDFVTSIGLLGLAAWVLFF